MTREPLAIDNLHIVIKVLAVVQLLGMAHRSIPSSNQGVQDPGFTGYPEVFQFREMMRTLSPGRRALPGSSAGPGPPARWPGARAGPGGMPRRRDRPGAPLRAARAL